MRRFQNELSAGWGRNRRRKQRKGKKVTQIVKNTETGPKLGRVGGWSIEDLTRIKIQVAQETIYLPRKV